MKKLMVAFAAVLAAGFSLTALASTGWKARPDGAVDLTQPGEGHIVSSFKTSGSNGWVAGPTSLFHDDGDTNNSAKRICVKKTNVDLIYTFDFPVVVNAYGIHSAVAYNQNGRAPKMWTIYGSNDFDYEAENFDTATWTAVDTPDADQTGWNGYRYYEASNPSAYKS